MDEMSTGVLQTPLAVLRAAGRELWVLRRYLYEGVGYVLVEAGRSDVVTRATVSGGGC